MILPRVDSCDLSQSATSTETVKLLLHANKWSYIRLHFWALPQTIAAKAVREGAAAYFREDHLVSFARKGSRPRPSFLPRASDLLRTRGYVLSTTSSPSQTGVRFRIDTTEMIVTDAKIGFRIPIFVIR